MQKSTTKEPPNPTEEARHNVTLQRSLLKQYIRADLFEIKPATATLVNIFTIHLLVNLLGDVHMFPNSSLDLQQICKWNDV